MNRVARAGPSTGDWRSIDLTDDESAAVIELGLRPTYSMVPCSDPEGDVELMLENAVLWMRAAEITSAGKARSLPSGLWPEIAAELDDAIPESVRDLGNLILGNGRWLDGDAGHGFPDFADAETEEVYEAYIERERRHLDALRSLAAKLGEAQQEAPPFPRSGRLLPIREMGA